MIEFGAQTTRMEVWHPIFPGLKFDLPPSFDYPDNPVVLSLVVTKNKLL